MSTLYAAVPKSGAIITEQPTPDWSLEDSRQHVRRILQVLKRPQRKVFAAVERFRVAIAGRRSGKTTGLGLNDLLYTAQTKPRAEVWYVAPTYRMARVLAWEPLMEAIPPENILDKDDGELTVKLRYSQSTIRCHGSQNYRNLVGRGLDHVMMDEFADQEREVWEEALRPALADKRGSALFVGTPRGFNWAYDLFLRAQNTPRWRSFQWTTLEAETVDPEEIELARNDMDPRIFRQEFEASFESLSGRVYGSFDRRPWPDGNLDASVELNETDDILFGIDFNVNPMSVVVGQRVGDELHIPYVLEIPSSNTEEMVEEIERRFERYPASRAKRGWGPRNFVAYPDASGNSRKTSAPVGQTDFTILQRAKFIIKAPPVNPPLVDRFNATNAMFCNAAGKRRIKIHPRCIPLIKCLDGLTYKEGTSLPDKASGLDHLPDALGYLVWEEFNLLKTRRPRDVQLPR